MQRTYLVGLVGLALVVSAACKDVRKVEGVSEAEPVKQDAAPAAAGALPARLKLFGSAQEAASAVFDAAIVDKAKIARVMEAAPTAEELRALCPTFTLQDQVDPALTKRYMEAACPYEETVGSLTPAQCREQLTDYDVYTNIEAVEDAASWGGCAALKLHTLQMGSIYCGEGKDDNGDEGNVLGFSVWHVVLFEHGGGWGVLFAKPGVDEAFIKARTDSYDVDNTFICEHSA